MRASPGKEEARRRVWRDNENTERKIREREQALLNSNDIPLPWAVYPSSFRSEQFVSHG